MLKMLLDPAPVREMWRTPGRGLYAVRTADQGIVLKVRQMDAAYQTHPRSSHRYVTRDSFLMLTPDRLALIVTGYTRSDTVVMASLPDHVALHALAWEMSTTSLPLWCESWDAWAAKHRPGQ